MTAIPLPVTVETAATALEVGGSLRVLVNQPDAGRTAQFRISSDSLAVEALPALGVVASGAALSGESLLVSGACPGGRACVLAVSSGGEQEWEALLEDVVPTFWPVVGCGPEPLVAWQQSAGEVRVATVGPEGFGELGRFPVGGPPLALAVTNGAVWVLWSGAGGVRAISFGRDGSAMHELSDLVASEVAAGASGNEVFLAWARGTPAFMATGRAPDEAMTFDLGPAQGGRLSVVAGRQPAVWATAAPFPAGANPAWVCALAIPDAAPLVIPGFVHAIAAWGDRFAVVERSGVTVLPRSAFLREVAVAENEARR